MKRLRLPALIVALVTFSCSGVDGDRSQPASGPASSGRGHAVTVTRVVDGDTIHVDIQGHDRTIRLIGIDTPETVAPGQPIECFGPEASTYATERLEGQTVRLEFDIERIDFYGRTLAYVWIGSELFNETLVRGGFALVTTYPPNVQYVDRFVRAQHTARRGSFGLWGSCP